MLPERELQANWEVDLAKKLEDYLLKVFSGQINDCEHLIPQVNSSLFSSVEFFF